MIILTGGLGFIGSNILSKLNYMKKKNILLWSWFYKTSEDKIQKL